MFGMERLLNEFVRRSGDILGNNLVGIYLHGSAVMGCFNPEKSDVDLIIVVDEPMPFSVKSAYMEMVVELNSLAPEKGIEMSVVKRSACSPFVYPTPYELHFSVGHLENYLRDPMEYVRTMNGVDWDLAAHFTVIRARGRCLCGAPIEEVFAPVPPEDYMDSIRRDIEDAEEEITEYPTYLILNLARVLAYKEQGLVLSKKEGGEWAFDNIPREHIPLVREALMEYESGVAAVYDFDSARRYARYMMERIERGEQK